MSKNRTWIFGAVGLACLGWTNAFSQTAVSNLVVAQRPGTRLVDISYDVSSDTTNAVDVWLAVDNAGTSVPATSLTGDVGLGDAGLGVATGTGKTIVWDAGADWAGNAAVLSYSVDAVSPPPPEYMVFVQGGTLPDIGNGELNVSSFYIGKYEVTWDEWQAVRAWAATNGYDIGGEGAGCASNHPVRAVSWYGVVKWCNAKSEMEGRTPVYTVNGSVYTNGQNNDVAVNAAANGYRLPTDPQWEFAARGGIHSQGYTYSGGNDINAVAWYDGNSGGAACNIYSGRGTWPVGLKGANELGIHDMSGNVWEWCFDWHPAYDGEVRVLRGGSWFQNADRCQVGWRLNDWAGNGIYFYGFRAVLHTGRQ